MPRSYLTTADPRKRIEFTCWRVAIWWPLDGFGGIEVFSSEAEALACRQRRIEHGHYPPERVYVWKVIQEVIAPAAEPPER
jgi:hypothetical protein